MYLYTFTFGRFFSLQTTFPLLNLFSVRLRVLSGRKLPGLEEIWGSVFGDVSKNEESVIHQGDGLMR